MPVEKHNFHGKKVLLTGAGGGIGRALSVRLHSYGAKVFALSRRQDTLDSLKKECPGVTTICVDLSDWKATENALKKLERMDIVINNAGLSKIEDFLQITPEIVDKIFDVNFKAVLNVSQICARKMIEEEKPGSIVNISSALAQRPKTMAKTYACSKAALDMLTRTMAMDLGPHKITVNGVAPAIVQTEFHQKAQTDGGKKLNPQEFQKNRDDTLKATPTRNILIPMDEVIDAVLFMASGISQITGSILPVDGGYCCT